MVLHACPLGRNTIFCSIYCKELSLRTISCPGETAYRSSLSFSTEGIDLPRSYLVNLSTESHKLGSFLYHGFTASIVAEVIKFSILPPASYSRMNPLLSSMGFIRMLVNPASSSIDFNSSICDAPAIHPA